jgi:hypothetical protein
MTPRPAATTLTAAMAASERLWCEAWPFPSPARAISPRAAFTLDVGEPVIKF